MFIQETYRSGSALDALYCELTHLQKQHAQLAAHGRVGHDIEILKWAIVRSLSGSRAASLFIARHGQQLLTMIHEQIAINTSQTH